MILKFCNAADVPELHTAAHPIERSSYVDMSYVINDRQWTFTDKCGNSIVCEWSDQFALEKVRHLFIEAQLFIFSVFFSKNEFLYRKVQAIWKFVQ